MDPELQKDRVHPTLPVGYLVSCEFRYYIAFACCKVSGGPGTVRSRCPGQSPSCKITRGAQERLALKVNTALCTPRLPDVTCHIGSHLPPNISECAPPVTTSEKAGTRVT